MSIYKSIPFKILFRIFFNKKKRVWIINDRLSGDGTHTVNQMFHFHPQCRLDRLGDNLFQVKLESGEPVLQVKLDDRLTPSLHWGEEDPVLGWFSPAFGEKVPAFTLKGQATVETRIYFKTLFWMV